MRLGNTRMPSRPKRPIIENLGQDVEPSFTDYRVLNQSSESISFHRHRILLKGRVKIYTSKETS